MFDFQLAFTQCLWAVPLINALTQTIKKLTKNTKFIYLFPVVIGLPLGLFLAGLSGYGVIFGLMLGLTANGTFNFYTNVTNKEE